MVNKIIRIDISNNDDNGERFLRTYKPIYDEFSYTLNNNGIKWLSEIAKPEYEKRFNCEVISVNDIWKYLVFPDESYYLLWILK